MTGHLTTPRCSRGGGLAVRCLSRTGLAITIFSAVVIGSTWPGNAAFEPGHTLTLDGFTVSYPDGWSVPPERLLNLHELVNVPADRPALVRVTTRIKITSENRASHAEALQRLAEVARGASASPEDFLLIGGWPALQLRRIEPREQPSEGPPFEDRYVLRIRTAIAGGPRLVRLEAALPSAAAEDLIDDALAIARSVRFAVTGEPSEVEAEIAELRRSGSAGGAGGSTCAAVCELAGCDILRTTALCPVETVPSRLWACVVRAQRLLARAALADGSRHARMLRRRAREAIRTALRRTARIAARGHISAHCVDVLGCTLARAEGQLSS